MTALLDPTAKAHGALLMDLAFSQGCLHALQPFVCQRQQKLVCDQYTSTDSAGML